VNLVYFQMRDGNTLTLDKSRITGLSQNRTPTDTPTRVLVDFAPGYFDVRNGFDESQRRLTHAP